MFVVRKIQSPNKIRDINIAIAYHNTKRSLEEIALEYGISATRVSNIHYIQVAHVLDCLDKFEHYDQMLHKNHNPEIAGYLQQYKDFLEGDRVKSQIIINDKNNEEALIITTNTGDDEDIIHVDVKFDHGAYVSMQDIKAALRKLSAK